PVLAAVGVGAATLAPQIDRMQGGVVPKLDVTRDDARCVSVGILLFLGTQHIEICRDRKDLELRGFAVCADAASEAETLAGTRRRRERKLSGLAQHALEFGRDRQTGFDEALADFRDQQNAIAIEAALARSLVGETELT